MGCPLPASPEPVMPPEVLLLKTEHERRNAGAEADEIVLRDCTSIRIHPESRFAFEHFCYISPVMTAELDSFIKLTADKTCLMDIGALHGIFCLAFAAGRPGRQAVAVDASSIAFARLLYNVHRNGLLSTVVPVECALSDTSGTLRMHYEWEHAVAANTAATEGAEQKSFSVKRRTGDELCQSLSFDPDVVKIDVEGHEVKVVTGLARVIKHNHPLIFLELHPGRIVQEGDNIADLVRLFASEGYRAEFLSGAAVALSDIENFTEDERVVLLPP